MKCGRRILPVLAIAGGIIQANPNLFTQDTVLISANTLGNAGNGASIAADPREVYGGLLRRHPE